MTLLHPHRTDNHNKRSAAFTLLELIVANGCDASETLSPSGVGGDVDDLAEVKRRIGGQVCLVGVMNQFQILTDGTPEQIRTEVHRLFDAAGQGGGYICSTSDHFFETPPGNLQAYADAGAIVFRKLDFFMVWVYLMLKRYDKLAEHYVPLDDRPRSEEEIIALLKERTRRISESELSAALA